MINAYSTHLQGFRPNISPMELVQVFGKKIADPWNRLVVRTGMGVSLWQPDSDKGVESMIRHHQECFKELKELKEKILPYASEHIKNRDKDIEEEKSKES